MEIRLNVFNRTNPFWGLQNFSGFTKVLKVCDGKAWASPFKQLHLGVKFNHTGFTVTQSYNFALVNFLLISL